MPSIDPVPTIPAPDFSYDLFLHSLLYGVPFRAGIIFSQIKELVIEHGKGRDHDVVKTIKQIRFDVNYESIKKERLPHMSIFLNLRTDGSIALYIDGDLQFDGRDEKIYHQGLALPALHLALGRQDRGGDLSALIVGGGDGLSARELIKSSRVGKIDLIDYSPEVLSLGARQLANLNMGSLADSRVCLHMQDAWQFAHQALSQQAQYDLIIVDLTVAKDVAGVKFHSLDWYRLVSQLLSPQGILAANCLSPTNRPRAFWSIFNSMRAAGLESLPYRVAIPSFSQYGYGPDWGFMLASKTRIAAEEFDGRAAAQALSEDLDRSLNQFKSQFSFPLGFADLQKESQPAGSGSEILLHYQRSDKPYLAPAKGSWSALTTDLASLSIPEIDRGKHLLPKAVRHKLAGKTATIFPAGASDLFDEVLALMPGLGPTAARSLIGEFILDPASFLEALDIKALVNKLVQRASELPQGIAKELKILQAKLVDWTGDYELLLDLGRQVVTTLAVVVILANFVFPDSAYGKGGFGGGHFGGGHYGGGFNRFGGGGWNRSWGNNWGCYGGWGRACHWNYWGYGGWGYGGLGYVGLGYGGIGGYGFYDPYYYASGPAYLATNYGGDQYPDGQGNQYPGNQYLYIQSDPTTTDPTSTTAATGSGTNDQNSDQSNAPTATTKVAASVLKAAYRLGPDVDVLTDGSTVIPLTETSYLKINSKKTEIVDQQSGWPLIALYTDPSLTWHLSSELKQQSNGLKRAAQAKEIAGQDDDPNAISTVSAQLAHAPNQPADKGTVITDRPPTAIRDATEALNLTATTKLLDKAELGLGRPTSQAPEATNPPVAGAVELFNSAWAEPGGKYVIFKTADGKLVYLDNRRCYTSANDDHANNDHVNDDHANDGQTNGKTKLDIPYPRMLKDIITAYLSDMVRDANSTKARLVHEQQEMQNQVTKLKQNLDKLQTDNAAGSAPAEPDNVQFGTKEIPRGEAIIRTKQLMDRAQKHLETVQNAIKSLPAETKTVNKLLTKFSWIED